MLLPNIRPSYQECLDHVENLVKAKLLIDPDFMPWSDKSKRKLAENIYLMHLAIGGDQELYEEVVRLVEKLPGPENLSLEDEFKFRLAYDKVRNQ